MKTTYNPCINEWLLDKSTIFLTMVLLERAQLRFLININNGKNSLNSNQLSFSCTH